MVTNHKIVCARAARHEFAEAYCCGIRDYRSARLYAAACGRELLKELPDDLPLRVLSQLHDAGVTQLAWDGTISVENADARNRSSFFRVLARKRPLQENEVEAGAYDSVTCEGINNAVVVHDGRVHRDGRTLYMSHSRFCLDRVFSENHGNDAIYEEAARPLAQAAMEGGRATLMLFGQTGTGKTYTATGILERLTKEIFAVDELKDDNVLEGLPRVTVLCYEFAGTHGGREAVFDLLAERAPVKCLTGEDGQVHVRGARSVPCRSMDELSEALRIALEWRSSESTERNAASSRSHAIIELQFPPSMGSEEASSGGILRIVDLAGSERNVDTQFHTRKMAERGGHINYSLLMLKECARIMHRNRQRLEDGQGPEHLPFRNARLTHLLQSCFMDEAHKTVVMATLSPSPTDVEHSLNTLQHVGMMRSGCLANRGEGGRKGAPSASPEPQQEAGAPFSRVDGRGHNLHSKLQDARAGQLKLHAFNLVSKTGGSVMKKYEPENVKTEAFIDPRWHREMKVVAERDLWVLREADAEAVQVLTEWREEQWEARRAHSVVKWDARAVQSFVNGLSLPGEVRLPSTMTGAQLCRLGRRGLVALCSDEATGEGLYEALLEERRAERSVGASQATSLRRLSALGANKVHVALEIE
mmetsp:Transcript_45086/g.97944  ORF Transcript_45086/g.97944 Transcript_45086/m.97944 type:complete len:646 (-) Transcript_45086:30-1967(-)